jgi:hypothetical protein
MVLITVIPATQEAEIGGSHFKAGPWQKQDTVLKIS